MKNFDKMAEEYADRVKLNPNTYRGDVVTAYVCGCMDSLSPTDINVGSKGEDKATYECQRCGAIYEIHNSQYMGCCTAPFPQRTSGICGGAIQIKHLNKLT